MAIRKGLNKSLPKQFFDETERNNRRMRQRGDNVQALPTGLLENDARLYVQVKNVTDLPVRRYALMTLGDLVFDTVEAMDEPMFELREPSGHPLETPVVVIDALPAGGTGKAIIRGLTPALVNHTAGDDHVLLVAPDDQATEHGAQDSTGNPTRVEIVHPATTLSMVLLKTLSAGWIFKTGVDGIDERSGTTCGSADCDAYWIDADGELAPLTDLDDVQITREVWNIATDPVGGETFIQAKSAILKLLCDVEYCGQP